MTEPTRSPSRTSAPIVGAFPQASRSSGRDQVVPAHPLEQLHSTIGNLGVLDHLSAVVQPSLEIGRPDDAYEHEAESVADAVMRASDGAAPISIGGAGAVRLAPDEDRRRDGPPSAMSAVARPATAPKQAPGSPPAQAASKKTPLPAVAKGPSPTAPAKQAPEAKRRDDHVATKAQPGASPQLTPGAARTIRDAAGGGSPLAPAERAFFEPRLGRDLSAVRIHDNAAAHHAARDIQARAFTYGSDVFFAAGRHQPGTASGRHLLAHELAHTIQQRPGRAVERSVQRSAATPTTAPVGPGTGQKKGSTKDAGSYDATVTPRTITLPPLKVPPFRLKNPENAARYSGALTRPLGYDRDQVEKSGAKEEKGPRAQRAMWTKTAQSSLKSVIGGILESDTFGKRPEVAAGAAKPSTYYLFSELATGEKRYYFGTPDQLARELAIPHWGRKGANLKGFDADHILELQLGGKNVSSNLQLLNESINRSSGSRIGGAISSSMARFLAALNLEDRTSRHDPELLFDTWASAWQVKFPGAEDDGSGLNVTEDDIWQLSEIQAGKHLEPETKGGVHKHLKLLDLTEVGASGEVLIFTDRSGGTGIPINTNGSPADWKLLSPFTIKSATFNTDPAATDATPLAEFTVSLEHAVLKEGKKEPTPISVARLPGARHMGAFNKPYVVAKLAKSLAVQGMSPVTLDELDLGPKGFMAGGVIESDLPLIRGARVGIGIEGNEVVASASIAGGQINVGPLFRVLASSLEVSVSSSADIAAQGAIAFEIPKVGQGLATARASKLDGIELTGSFDVATDTFAPARLEVAYRQRELSLAGQLGIPAGKVRGIKNASLTASYAKDRFTATGTAQFDVPGIESASVDLTYEPATGLVVKGNAKLQGLPGLSAGELNLTAVQAAGGGPLVLSGSGKGRVNLAGVSADVLASYADGLFLASTTVPYKAGLLDGTLELGVTNGTVDDAGKVVPGGATGAAKPFGAGTATVQIAPWLAGTAGIRLLSNGEVEVRGELSVPGINLYEGKDLVDRDLIPAIHVDIPIVPPVVLGLGAGLRLKVGYGPGVLSGSLGITYNPSHPDRTHLYGTAKLHASAFAGLQLYTTIGLGVGFAGASVTGNIELSGELRLDAAADAVAQLDWTPSKGISIDTTLKVEAQPALVIRLAATVLGTLGPLSYEFWRKDLAGYRWGSGMTFGLTWPIHYEPGKPFAPSTDDIQINPPAMKPEQVASQILKEQSAAP